MDGEEYNIEDDLGILIDDRMQSGKTAAKIGVARITINVLAKLLIDKGIITEEEFVEPIRAREKELTDNLNAIIEKHSEDKGEQQGLNDAKRHLETMKEAFDSVCVKASE